MKTPEHERLLHDVLATPDYSTFRDQLQHRLRHQLRRRRQWQHLSPYLALAASVVLLGVILLRDRTPSAPLTLVRTKALTAVQTVHTAPQSIARVRSTPPPAIILTARDARPLPRLTDEALLALFPGKSVALIAAENGRKQLLFLDQENPQAPAN